MMNNLKNYEKSKIDKIEDKLINIVNKFHQENSINNINMKKKSKTIRLKDNKKKIGDDN